MIVLGKWGKDKLAISVKPNCLTISLENAQRSDVFSYDLEGRPWTAMAAGVSYRRGLDGKTVAKWITPNNERGRRWMDAEEAENLAEQARQIACRLLSDLEKGQGDLDISFPEAGMRGLKKAAQFDSDHRKSDKEIYDQIYLPVGILPPDQYGAVVLQATEGCSFNACTFCNFYKDRPFRVKSVPEFASHCEKVRAFLGEGLSLRRTIFLGDANALVIPMPRLVNLLETARHFFDVDNLGGIYAFLDGVSGERKSPRDYARLASLGLERVYIGLESGSASLLRYLNKPSTPQEVLNTVQALKRGGVAVGIIVLLGAGGHQYAREHVRETITILNKMNLDMDDILYFSELIESEGMEYLHKAYQQELIPLSSEERIQQGQAIQEQLRFSPKGGAPHISRYDIREFVY